jgi:uncharacterized protein YjbI with pentapeptide repeats
MLHTSGCREEHRVTKKSWQDLLARLIILGVALFSILLFGSYLEPLLDHDLWRTARRFLGIFIAVALLMTWTYLVCYLLFGWRPTRRHALWVVGIAVSVALVATISTLGYKDEWTWTGFVKDTDYSKRTLWDWLDLLIVPVVLAIGGYLFTRSENRATLAAAERRAQDEALQAYLDQVGQLLIDKDTPLRQSEDNEVRPLARAQTLTVLSRLDDNRKARVVQFLYEAALIAKDHPVLGLSGADLSGTNLHGSVLSAADLRESNLEDAVLRDAHLSDANLTRANLKDADLRGANLHDANLFDANLRGAVLHDAKLHRAILARADLTEAKFSQASFWAYYPWDYISPANLSSADLRGAILVDANLPDAHLSGANLRGANLTDADLRGAFLSGADLKGAVFEGATMPNGQKYEDWLESKNREEDGETE